MADIQITHLVSVLTIALLSIATITHAIPYAQSFPINPIQSASPQSIPHCYDPPIPIPPGSERSHFKPFTKADCQPLLDGLRAWQYYRIRHEWLYPTTTSSHQIPEGFAWYHNPCLIYIQTEPGEKALFSLETVINATDGIFDQCTLPRLPGFGGFAELPGELAVWTVIVMAMSDGEGEGEGGEEEGWDRARALSEIGRYGRELRVGGGGEGEGVVTA